MIAPQACRERIAGTADKIILLDDDFGLRAGFTEASGAAWPQAAVAKAAVAKAAFRTVFAISGSPTRICSMPIIKGEEAAISATHRMVSAARMGGAG